MMRDSKIIGRRTRRPSPEAYITYESAKNRNQTNLSTVRVFYNPNLLECRTDHIFRRGVDMNCFVYICLGRLVTIPNSLQNPKILVGYDPEIIGDGISPFCPLLWQSSAEEIEDSVDEVPEVGMEPVVGHFAVHDSP